MKIQLLILPVLILVIFFVQAAHAEIKNEIASFDKSMIRACEVAEINAAKSRKYKIESFLRVLSILETQYQNSGDKDSLLACRKSRAKYDPSAEKVDQPTKIPEQLSALVTGLEKQLNDIERYKTKTIDEAKNGRFRKLTALLRGLQQRGEKEDAQLVIEALKSPPPLPKFDPLETEGKVIIPKEVAFLTYDRPRKRWVAMENKGVKSTSSKGTTTLHYVEGVHGLLKVDWPDVLEVGDRFSVEVKGVNSVEAVDLDGADANARFNLPESDEFITVDITREKDQIVFTCNGERQKTFYASGKLRGDDAKAALTATPLRAAFSIKKGEQASFRNAKIIRL